MLRVRTSNASQREELTPASVCRDRILPARRPLRLPSLQCFLFPQAFWRAITEDFRLPDPRKEKRPRRSHPQAFAADLPITTSAKSASLPIVMQVTEWEQCRRIKMWASATHVHRRGPVARVPHGLGAWGQTPATTYRLAASKRPTDSLSKLAAKIPIFPMSKCRPIVAVNRHFLLGARGIGRPPKRALWRYRLALLRPRKARPTEGCSLSPPAECFDWRTLRSASASHFSARSRR
jgi:hypothetical protein